jgi:hypothetical protein
VRAPTGAHPRNVRWWGDARAGGRVLTGDHVLRVPLDRFHERDMYVDPDLSRATAEATGRVTVVPDEDHHHDGLRRGGAEILERLEHALAEAAPDAVAPTRPEPGGGAA